MKVCVDAGHGGNDPGAVGTDPFRLAEKEVTLQVSSLLEQELEQRGHKVVMTRRRDRSLESQEALGEAVADGLEAI